MLLWTSEAGEMDVKQLYGRNDMVMLEQHNKIYGSLGIVEQTILKTEEGNPVILKNPKPGVAESVITDFKMQGWTEQDSTPTPETPVPIVNAGSWNEDTQKWECEISVGGAQLFDISKVITEEGVVINNGDGTLTVKTSVSSNGVAAKSPNRLRDYCPDIVSGKTYYLYADSTGSEKFIYFGKSMSLWYFGSSKIITDDDLDSTVFFYASGLTTEATVSNIMITEVSNAPYEQYKPPQTVLLTADRPLTKWDRLEKRNGQWGWVYKSAEIESYTDESVPGEYFSTTGRLSTGAQVWYETTTETFVPLSESEQEQMNTLEMYLPTTVITNDVDCSMIVTYKTTQNGGE